jgi:hypothetical protein
VTTFATAAEMNAVPGFASGDIDVRTTCASGPNAACVPDALCATNCPGEVIQGFAPAPEYGSTTLFSARWHLTSDASCRVTDGASEPDPVVTADADGVARTKHFSIGAYELDRVCP